MTENTITDFGLHNPPPPPLVVSRAMAVNSWRLGEGGGHGPTEPWDCPAGSQ